MRNHIVCAVTGTRAEYGLLRPLLARLAADPEFELRVLATGTHLSQEFGYTCREIETDGYPVDAKIEMLLASDTAAGMAKSTGLGMISFADYFAARRPDMCVVLGDRFETFAAATAAAMMRIPVAHICGGDTTEGAVDEFLRHSITKMSALHFPSNGESRRRVIQLGERPDTVFDVGALNVECIKGASLLSRGELERELGVDLSGGYALVTFHPVTLAADTRSAVESTAEILLRALAEFPAVRFIITKANADSGGRAINAVFDRAVNRAANNISVFSSLGSLRYLSAMSGARAVIGNSSSALYEAPVFGVPAVNIGDRQKGRTAAANVINCKPVFDDIVLAVNKALSPEFAKTAREARNPFGDGNASALIAGHIKTFLKSGRGANPAKEFYNNAQF